MQDNPFYPGYHPGEYKGDTPGSPLYPGYYPGQPIERRPIPREFLGSAEYDIDMFFQAINSADMTLGGDLAGPRWFKDRLVDDFKQKTKAQIFGEGVTAERLDDYETESLPGAFGIGISLHPGDWTDPKKQLKKTLESWGKAAVSLEDFDNRTRVELWKNLINSEKLSDFGLGESTIFERAAPVGGMPTLAAATAARAGIAVADRNNPLTLKNTGVYKERRGEDEAKDGVAGVVARVDLGDKVGQSILEFQRNRDSAFYRDSKFTGVILASMEFTQQELQNRKDEIPAMYQGAVATNDLHYRILFGGEETTVDRLDATGNLVQKTVKLEGMQGVSKSLADTKKTMNKAALGVKGSYEDIEKELKTLKRKIEDNRDNFEFQINKAETLAAGGTIADPTAVRFKNRQNERLAYLNNLEQVVDKHLDHFSQVTSGARRRKPNARSMAREFENVVSGNSKWGTGKGLSGGDIVQFSLQSDAALDWLDEATISRMRKQSATKPRYLGSYSKEKDPDRLATLLEDHDMGLESSKIKTYLERLHADRIDSAVDQFMGAFSGQRLIENFIWRKVSSRIKGYTPGSVAEKVLSQAHFFGLKIDNDFVSEAQATNTVFKKLYTYKFKVHHHVDGKVVGSVLKGSEAFKPINNIGTLFSLEKAGQLNENVLKTLLTSGDIHKGMSLQDTKDFLEKLKGIQGGELPFFTTNTEKIRTFFKEFAAMKEELKNQLPNVDWDNPDVALEFYRKLYAYHKSPDALGINIPFAGYLQKLWMGLNRFQTAIMNSPIGKPITYAFSWKNILVERSTAFLTKTLPNLLTKIAERGGSRVIAAVLSVFAGGGIAAPIMNKVLLPIVRFFLRKGIDFGTATLKGLLKGDWEAAIRMLEKDIRKMIDTVTKILYIPVAAMMAIGLGFLGTTATTVSPIDPYDGNAGYAGGFASARPGENDVVRVRKDVIVHLTDGSEVVNPGDPIPNGTVESIDYRVVITPLGYTITDGSVTWNDIGRYRTESNSEIFFQYPDGAEGGNTEVLDPFVSNQEIIFTFEDAFPGIDGLEDAVVSNTATVFTPHIAADNIPADVVNFTRSFIIGDFVPECPLAGISCGYHISTYSYENNASDQHGSTDYWTAMCDCSRWGGDTPCPWEGTRCDTSEHPIDPSCDCVCAWSMPGAAIYASCMAPDGPENSGNICRIKGLSECEYYGYSLDVAPGATYADNCELGPVLAPPLGDPDRVWTMGPCSNEGAYQGNLMMTSEDGSIVLHIYHIDEHVCSGTVAAGGTIGYVYNQPNNEHIHIEMTIGGVPVKPECFMCAAAIPADCPSLP